MATATVTSKGQITLPKAVRERLHLDTGDRVDFVVKENGEVVLRPFGSDVQELRGLLQRGGKRALSVETMNKAVLREHSRKR
jgi:AbrB family looped-hinge helix DNA binding protein